MHPNAPDHLRDLHRLASRLFDVVCGEFTTGAPVTVRFERIDDLAEKDIDEQHVVATALLCAQLLHRVTTEPALTQPRHVMTLADIIEQVVTQLATLQDATDSLLEVGGDIAQTAYNLAVSADPGGPDFDLR